jgi:TonB family protein
MYAPTLIESRRPLASGGAIGGGALSFLIHAALIAAAVYATLSVTRVVEQARLVVDLALPREETPPPPPRTELPTLAPLPAGFRTLEIPTTILTEIPPPSRAPFDPTGFTGIELEAATPVAPVAAAGTPAADAVYDESLVEQLPVRIGGDSPRYPPMLQAARIPGQATVECVVDTLGRVEPGSITTVRSTHELFARAAAEAVATWRFRPGRIAERPVRARVRLPINFTL